MRHFLSRDIHGPLMNSLRLCFLLCETERKDVSHLLLTPSVAHPVLCPSQLFLFYSYMACQCQSQDNYRLEVSMLFFFSRLIAFQCCGALCCTSRGIHQNPIYVPSLLSLPPPPPTHPTPQTRAFLAAGMVYAVVWKWRQWRGICMRDEVPL